MRIDLGLEDGAPMISHEHRLIFIHIPKCAGTSVERRFGHWDGFAGRNGQDHRPMRMIETPANMLHVLRSVENAKLRFKRSILSYRKGGNPRNRLTVTPEQFRDYYKFTIVRDPWSRVYSWYRNVKADPAHRKNLGVDPDLSLDAFVDRFGGRGMVAPIPYWLRLLDGTIRIDREVRFDALQEGFAAVCRDLGLPDDALEHHHGGGERLDLAVAYSPRARDAIARIYAEEIARYGFVFPA